MGLEDRHGEADAPLTMELADAAAQRVMTSAVLEYCLSSRGMFRWHILFAFTQS